MNRKALFITVAAVLAALFAGAVALYQNQQAEAAARAAAKNKESLVRFHSPSLGKADARVHIVEFLDPACETCAAFYPFVKKMMAQHPDDIRLSVRYAPLHQGSDEVVKALEAVGRGEALLDPAMMNKAFARLREAARKDRGEAFKMLTEQETIPWGMNPTIRLLVAELVTGNVVGGALVERQDNRVCKLRVTAGGPDRSGEAAQLLRAAVLRLLVPWVMGELNMMTAVIDVPADEAIVIDAAARLGMVEVVRLREHIARPSGRVDLLMLERVNREWGRGGRDA